MKPLASPWLLLALCGSPLACKADKTTHSVSATFATLDERQRFLERYVTFRRTYDALEFKIDFVDDTSFAPGPSAVACDIRLYAKVPSDQLPKWSDGLEPWPAPTDLGWAADMPSAPADLAGFAWYRDRPSDSGAGRVAGVSQASSEVLYRNVCARN